MLLEVVMKLIKTVIILFAALFCGSYAPCAANPQSDVFYEHITTNLSSKLENQMDRQSVAVSAVSIEEDDKEEYSLFAADSPALQQFKQENQHKKYRWGKKRYKNTGLSPFSTPDVSASNNCLKLNFSLEPKCCLQHYSTRLPDALVISIHKLSNVIEPLE